MKFPIYKRKDYLDIKLGNLKFSVTYLRYYNKKITSTLLLQYLDGIIYIEKRKCPGFKICQDARY